MFKEVDSSWKSSMDLVQSTPNVLAITETTGLLDELRSKNDTLQTIYKGLEAYVDKKRISFTRSI